LFLSREDLTNGTRRESDDGAIAGPARRLAAYAADAVWFSDGAGSDEIGSDTRSEDEEDAARMSWPTRLRVRYNHDSESEAEEDEGVELEGYES
jgi:hypothetical protein